MHFLTDTMLQLLLLFYNLFYVIHAPAAAAYILSVSSCVYIVSLAMNYFLPPSHFLCSLYYIYILEYFIVWRSFAKYMLFRCVL